MVLSVDGCLLVIVVRCRLLLLCVFVCFLFVDMRSLSLFVVVVRCWLLLALSFGDAVCRVLLRRVTCSLF